MNGIMPRPAMKPLMVAFLRVPVGLWPIRKLLPGKQAFWLGLVLDPHTAGTANVVLYRTCLD
jgi:hypothetical protein